MPALNEARYIEQAIRSIACISNAIDYEILVLDGGSTDSTAEIVNAISLNYPAVRLVHNESRTQASALNKAAVIADPRSDYLLRADCHAQYPEGFVEACVHALVSTKADAVVVPMSTVGGSCMQQAIATAQNSRLGNGGSAHRLGGFSGWVDHGHHAVWRRRSFLAVGGYDEAFTHNEDAELDVRLRKAGFNIWLNGKTTINYFPRSSLRGLALQYFRHGKGRAKTLLKHRLKPKPRQLLPLVVVALGLASVLLAPLIPFLLLIPIGYISCALLIGAGLAVTTATPCAVASGLAALVMHASWAAGFATNMVSNAYRGKARPAGADHSSIANRSLELNARQRPEL